MGDFAIDANSSLVEVLCHGSKPAALMAALAPATYTRLVEGPKAHKRLFEILNDFADWLGLRAHTLLSLASPSESK